MRVTRFFVIALIATVLFTMGQSTPVEGRIDKLRAQDGQIRLAEAKAILKERERLVVELIAIVNSPAYESSKPQLTAATLLGELRSPEAVPALIKRLHDFEVGITKGEPLDSIMAYRRALAQIGLPAVPALVEELRNPESKERSGALFVLFYIFGERNGGLEHLTRLLDVNIAKETSQEAKSALEVARKDAVVLFTPIEHNK